MDAVINGMGVVRIEQHLVIRTKAREMSMIIPEMIGVARGLFPMGNSGLEGPYTHPIWWGKRDNHPIRQVTLSDFAIGKYPVTNREYLGFLQVMGRSIPDLVANPEFALHPVVNVSWYAANEYCTFLNDLKIQRNITGIEGSRKFSLPTEAQWEFAARGTEGRIYPWGNESYEGRVNFNTKGTTPVDAFPSGATPSGIFDMSGNVWEWKGDWYAYGYNPRDLTDPQGQFNGTSLRVMRGGSCYNFDEILLLAAYRGNSRPESQSPWYGFRLAENF
jgi:formylglycine-generating enzyme required for sulfatase activity